jgi:H-type lectin domain
MSGKMTLASLALGWTCLSCVAYAQDTEKCTDVLSLSRNQKTTLYGQSDVESSATNFCSAYQHYKQTGDTSQFGASYLHLAATFQGSHASYDEVASQYCSQSDFSKATEEVYNRYTNLVAPGAFAAYQACIESTKRYLHFVVDTSSILPDEFAMSVSYDEPGPNKSASLNVSPTQSVKCSWNNSNSLDVTLKSVSQAILSCHRSVRSQPSTVTIIRTDGVDHFTLPWQAYTADGLPQNAMQALQDGLSELQQQIAALQKTATNIRHVETGSVSLTGQSTPVTFPPGAFRAAPKVMLSITNFYESGGPNFNMSIVVDDSKDHSPTKDGFTIKINSNTQKLILGNVYWIAIEQ